MIPFPKDLIVQVEENPMFYPKKHTVMSYREQQRLAKKMKNKRKIKKS